MRQQAIKTPAYKEKSLFPAPTTCFKAHLPHEHWEQLLVTTLTIYSGPLKEDPQRLAAKTMFVLCAVCLVFLWNPTAFPTATPAQDLGSKHISQNSTSVLAGDCWFYYWPEGDADLRKSTNINLPLWAQLEKVAKHLGEGEPWPTNACSWSLSTINTTLAQRCL